jgi:hypothetical protein
MKQSTLDKRTIGELGSALVIVKDVLKNWTESRGDDRLLIDLVDWKCRANRIDLISPETITRVRRKIQYNENMFLPTKEIQEHRKKKEQCYSDFFG